MADVVSSGGLSPEGGISAHAGTPSLGKGAMSVQTTLKDRMVLERAAEHYVQACFRNKTAVRASELATELQVTPAYLSRTAREIIGEPISEFLRKKQIAYAVRLLCTTALTIEEIALGSGFGTATTFYRAFRKAFVMTPAAYRQVKK
jgi:AraC-like DNA-binding protein